MQRIFPALTPDRLRSGTLRRRNTLAFHRLIRIGRRHRIAIHRQRWLFYRRLLLRLRLRRRLLAPPAHHTRHRDKPSRRHQRPEIFTAKVHSTPGDYAPSAPEVPAAVRVVSSIYASSHPASPRLACTRSHTRSL